MPWVPRGRRCALPVQGACAERTADLGLEGCAGVCRERKEACVTAEVQARKDAVHAAAGPARALGAAWGGEASSMLPAASVSFARAAPRSPLRVQPSPGGLLGVTSCVTGVTSENLRVCEMGG